MRKSKLSIISDKELKQMIASGRSRSEILETVGLRTAGGNFKTLERRLDGLGLLEKAKENSKNRRAIFLKGHNRPTPATVFQKGSRTTRGTLKRLLIKTGALERCAKCGLGNSWCYRKLVLQLDHINGIWNDNRRKNLRLLCPNCHSQTETFAGKNAR